MSTNVKVSHELDVLMVSAFNTPTDYIFLQRDTDEESEMFFEYNDEKNTSFNNVSECFVNEMGVQIITKSGDNVDFRFSNLTDIAQARLLAGLKDMFALDPAMLTIEL